MDNSTTKNQFHDCNVKENLFMFTLVEFIVNGETIGNVL